MPALAVIAARDMPHVRRLRHVGMLVDIAQIAGQVREVRKPLAVAPEQPMINGIEAKQARGELPVGFRQALSVRIAARSQNRF